MSEYLQGDKLYPLKFVPVYVSRMWGGNKMEKVLNRVLPGNGDPIGESWEISDRPGAESVVANGVLAGKTLPQLIKQYGSYLLGKGYDGVERFPLLIKIIDAGERLSLQVHPDTDSCHAIGDGAEPKTEMWYIISADPGAKILAGLSAKATRHQLTDLISSPEVENLLQVYPSAPGDAYFIPSGTLHAIGAGNLILEIQQNSDTTYRISDWGRVGSDGKSRELHIEKGLQSINFMNRKSPRIAGAADKVKRNRKYDVVSMCPYFKVADLRLVESRMDDTGYRSFHLLSAINSPFKVVCTNGAGEISADKGETVMIPACVGSYRIEPCCAETEECIIVRTTL